MTWHRRQRLFGTYLEQLLIVNDEQLITFDKELKKPLKQFFRGQDNTFKIMRPTEFINDNICDKFFSQSDNEQLLNIIMEVQDWSILNASLENGILSKYLKE